MTRNGRMRASDGIRSYPALYGITIALFVYGWLSVNIYLPVLPKLEEIFKAAPELVQFSVTVFLVGFSISQLFWGPLSDRFGRRLVLTCGLAISVGGAFLTALTSDIYLFFAARFVEAVGVGVAPVLARAVLMDLLDRNHLAIAMTYAVISVAVTNAFAPIIGGYLDLLLSWRSIFFFLALLGGVISCLCLLFLPETQKEKNPTLRVRDVAGGFLTILSDSRYLGYLIFYGIAYGGIVGYYAAAPYIFINELGYRSHTYGFLLIANAACFVAGGVAARFAIPKIGPDRVIVAAVAIFLFASALLFLVGALMTMTTLSVLLPISIFVFAGGLATPAANAGAMAMFRDHIGPSTAIIGFSMAIGGAIMNAGLSTFDFTRLWQLGAYVGIVALAGLAAYLGFLRTGSEETSL